MKSFAMDNSPGNPTPISSVGKITGAIDLAKLQMSSSDSPRILALDLANRTGWAYLTEDGDRDYGTWDLVKRGDSHPGARVDRLRRGLVEFLEECPAEILAFEDAQRASLNWNTGIAHAELRGIVKEVACSRGIELLSWYPITIKAYAGCAGKTTRKDKTAMIRACERLLGITVYDDNIADALWILELARQSPDSALERVSQRKRKKPRKKSVQRKLFR